MGHGKLNSICFHSREIIAVSIAMNVTARSPSMTQRNDFSVIPFLLHKSTPQRKVFMFASDQQHMPSRWLNLSFYDSVILFYLYGIWLGSLTATLVENWMELVDNWWQYHIAVAAIFCTLCHVPCVYCQLIPQCWSDWPHYVVLVRLHVLCDHVVTANQIVCLRPLTCAGRLKSYSVITQVNV